MLSVYVDFACPGSYLALDPTLALLNALHVPCSWHPYRNRERDLPREGADAATIASHDRVRRRSVLRAHERYARLRGMELNIPLKPRSVDLALACLADLDGDRRSYVCAAFEAYWTRGEDLNSASGLERVLTAAGRSDAVPVRGTEAKLEAAQARAETEGVVAAPAYLFDGEVFVGRQHLPLLKELIHRTLR